MWRAASTLLLAAALSGCASDYVARTARARADYERYDYKDAVDAFKREVAKGPPQDHLLALMDEGMVEHASGQWQASIQSLAAADQLAEQLDYTSIHEEAAALATGDRVKSYRGEDFEQVMISVLQGLNYAMVGKEQDALVEERRVNDKLQEMASREKRDYQQLAIARYLSGVLYEDLGKADDAIVDYQAALEVQPQLGGLAEPLVRLARQRNRQDLLHDLSQKFPGIEGEPLGPQEGQLVVVVEEGLAPQKVPDHPGDADVGRTITVPIFVDRGQSVPPQVSVDGGAWQPSVLVTNLSMVAKRDLHDRIGRMVGKQLAGTAVKAGLAAAAGALTKNKDVGWLTFWLLSMGNQTDLRSWMSLPAQFDLARYRLPAGAHTVWITQRGYQLKQDVQIAPGRISLWVVRQY